MEELTVKQAAERLGIDPARIRDYLKRKVLSSRFTVENGRTKHYIPEAEVEALRREREAQATAEKKGKGRPPKTKGDG